MLRKIQVLLVLAAFLVALFPARALAADVGEVRWKSGKGGEYVETKSGRYFKVTRATITTFEGMENFHRYMAGRSALTEDNSLGFGELAYPEEASLINRVFANASLFWRAWGDINRVLSDPRATEENLCDLDKRYQLYKDHGFYERYTAQERAFINATVIPMVAASKFLRGAAGVGMAALGVALLAGGSFLVPALAVGLGAYIGLTLAKTWAVKGRSDVVGGLAPEETYTPDPVFFAGATGAGMVVGAGKVGGMVGLTRVAGSILFQRLAGWLGGVDTLSRVFSGVKVTAGYASGVVAGLGMVGIGTYWASEGSADFARVMNISGIPEPVSYQELWEEASVGSRDVKVETVEELSLDYRLTK